MNKADLADKIAEIVGTSKEAKEVVDCIIKNMTAALKGGEEVIAILTNMFRKKSK